MRFAIIDDHRVLDLATGERVALTITKSAAPSEQRRWAVRCDGLHKLHHRSLAWLLDYGTIGESQRFEAWDCGPRWIGA